MKYYRLLKRIFIVLAVIGLFSGCAAEEQPTDVTDEEIAFTRDDLCLYSEREEGVAYPVVWIGMDKNEYDPQNEYIKCFGENDIKWREAVTSEKTPTQCIKFINYSGGIRKGMETVKGIYSTGMYFNEEHPSSAGEDVIKAYGLDPEKETIYSDKADEKNYTITLYFAKDEDNKLIRLVSTEDDPINTADEEVRFILRFLVTDGHVSNIQMMENHS